MFTELLMSCRSKKFRSPVPEKSFDADHASRPADRACDKEGAGQRLHSRSVGSTRHLSVETIAANIGASPEP